jgi:protein-tyrosine phosphatase
MSTRRVLSGQGFEKSSKGGSTIIVVVPFAILFVCTGNVCRSPMAELLCRGWADPRADLVVGSAGMRALVGHGIDTSTASVLGQLGLDPTRHRARQFRPELAATADLVLTAEAVHRDTIMADVPNAFRRTFTMKEFARLTRHATAEDPSDVVAELAGRRGADGPPRPGSDDMPDPYLGKISQARAVAAVVNAAVQATVQVLGFAVPPSEPLVAAGADRRPSPRPRPRPQPR